MRQTAALFSTCSIILASGPSSLNLAPRFALIVSDHLLCPISSIVAHTRSHVAVQPLSRAIPRFCELGNQVIAIALCVCHECFLPVFSYPVNHLITLSKWWCRIRFSQRSRMYMVRRSRLRRMRCGAPICLRAPISQNLGGFRSFPVRGHVDHFPVCHILIAMVEGI